MVSLSEIIEFCGCILTATSELGSLYTRVWSAWATGPSAIVRVNEKTVSSFHLDFVGLQTVILKEIGQNHKKQGLNES